MPNDALDLTNRRFSDRLGWEPADLGAPGFGSPLVERIRARQADLDVPVDGVFGPISYAAHLARAAAALRAVAATAPADLAAAGRLAAVEAKRLWLRGVVDPPDGGVAHAAGRAAIDALIRGDAGLSWDWEDPYQADGDFEWCGAFAAWAWGAAGVAPALRRRYFASTYRLDRFARYARIDAATANPRPVDAPRRWLALDEDAAPDDAWFGDHDPPRPGDLLLVGPARSDYGKHVCVVERFEPAAGAFVTLEGNATGALPSGRRAHGVVRTRRPIGLGPDEPRTRYHVRRVLRPSVHDLIGPGGPGGGGASPSPT